MSVSRITSLPPPPSRRNQVRSDSKKTSSSRIKKPRMPRRVAGKVWAIRITATLSEEEETLFKIPNTVCVYHAGGSRGKKGFQEKPHYHLYYNAGTEVTKDTVQSMIRSNSVVQKYYKASNGFWSIDSDEKYDLNTYWEYVWNDYPAKKQRLVWWDIEEEQLPIPESLILVSPGNIIATGPLDSYRGRERKQKISTSLEKQMKFLKYCKDYYDDFPTHTKTPRDILKLLYEYCKGNGFTTESCCFVWVNYVLANISTDDEYKENRRQFTTRLQNKFFS